LGLRLDVVFDLDFSLCCGQVFRWRKFEGWWYGVVDDHVVKIRQSSGNLEFENVNEEFVRNYFGLDDNLEKISRCIGKDD
jgi:N-glycosylase/DNA lyase